MANAAIDTRFCKEFLSGMDDQRDADADYEKSVLDDEPDVPGFFPSHTLLKTLGTVYGANLKTAENILSQLGENITVPEETDNMDDNEFRNLPVTKLLNSIWLNGRPMFEDVSLGKRTFHVQLLNAVETISKAVTSNVSDDQIPYIREEDGTCRAITPAFEPAAASTKPPFYKRWFQGIVPSWREDVKKYETALTNKERSEKLEKKVREIAGDSAENQNAAFQPENANTDKASRRRTSLNELGGTRISQSRQDNPARENANTHEPLSRQAPTKQPPAGRKH